MGVKIAVIGGGIGGLTTAIALARQGITVEVYEQAGAGAGSAVRDALMRTTPRSVQVRQLDLILALRTDRDRR